MSIKEFYHTVETKTSQPSIFDYTEVFTPILSKGEDILCICISSKFSGSIQSAYNAKEQLKETYPDRDIVIIDSLHATGSQGLLVIEAAKL